MDITYAADDLALSAIFILYHFTFQQPPAVLFSGLLFSAELRIDLVSSDSKRFFKLMVIFTKYMFLKQFISSVILYLTA